MVNVSSGPPVFKILASITHHPATLLASAATQYFTVPDLTVSIISGVYQLNLNMLGEEVEDFGEVGVVEEVELVVSLLSPRDVRR
jgi:hypothetical protein